MQQTYLCPKDQTPMRVFERNGVSVERCPECGGLFLDRGELEHLTQAEARYAARSYDDDDDDRGLWRGDEREDRRDDRRGYPPQRRRRRNFLEEFLDFG